ncbi:K+-sensing histidine kinase KdpD [Pedobacter cryoconitis]|uniref:GAF domain-containing sensor histidine kinase n=1 Tax=Pedobacter cryoconitis TaxID=188932 RepID=UPI00160F6862|nr:GAF domain-containing sensor histidine kinase [Pedobacter cryoconitis]MBB6272703.1 K+-sensing histidine kinase KdpD [Pedobacter cryoconitis]
MQKNLNPVPANELERICNLAEFDIDYSCMENNFKDLVHLAASIAGTEVSLINLIDTFTQWTYSSYGMDGLIQAPREDTVCQYTIMENEYFEVPDLSADERFKENAAVSGPPNFRYYFGVPLTTAEGINIGSLCVLDQNLRQQSPEKIELLKIVASEVVNRLKALKAIDELKHQLDKVNETQKKVAHDIRGPIAGIVGLAAIIAEQGDKNNLDEVLEFITMIHKSGRSVLELADEILTEGKDTPLKADEFNLLVFKEKLERLYLPQSMNKHIDFQVRTNEKNEHIPFIKNKLLQITGNLISNALKFTPQDGRVIVDLDLKIDVGQYELKIRVEDSGVGMDEATITCIMEGKTSSTKGTVGEKGYGFGLSLVKHLVNSLHGSFNIYSRLGIGTSFEITLFQTMH